MEIQQFRATAFYDFKWPKSKLYGKKFIALQIKLPEKKIFMFILETFLSLEIKFKLTWGIHMELIAWKQSKHWKNVQFCQFSRDIALL